MTESKTANPKIKLIIPKKKVDILRGMKVKDYIELKDEVERSNRLIMAKRLLPDKTFISRKIEGKIYLFRTA